MKKITRLISVCSTITTATLIVCTFWIFINTIESGGNVLTEKIDLMILPQILAVGLVTGLGTKFILDKDDAGRREGWIRHCIHFVFICAAVLGLGAWFGWYSFSLPGVILMMLSILAVYAVTYFINYYQSKQLADKVNEKLEQMNREE